MDPTDARTALASFVATGDEAKDVARLYKITDSVKAAGIVVDLIPDLLAIFERNPKADLGSPGPIVHCIETIGMDGFIPYLVRSLRATPTMMTLWMAERCLRSSPSQVQLGKLLAAIGTVPANDSASEELRSEAASTLALYAP